MHTFLCIMYLNKLPWDKIWTGRKLISVQWVWKAAIYEAQLISLPRSGTFWNRFSLGLVYIKEKMFSASTMYIIPVFPKRCQFTLERPPQSSNLVCWGAESILLCLYENGKWKILLCTTKKYEVHYVTYRNHLRDAQLFDLADAGRSHSKLWAVFSYSGGIHKHLQILNF